MLSSIEHISCVHPVSTSLSCRFIVDDLYLHVRGQLCAWAESTWSCYTLCTCIVSMVDGCGYDCQQNTRFVMLVGCVTWFEAYWSQCFANLLQGWQSLYSRSGTCQTNQHEYLAVGNPSCLVAPSTNLRKCSIVFFVAGHSSWGCGLNICCVRVHATHVQC